MTTLPVSVAATAGAALQVVDYRSAYVTTTPAGADGTMTATFPYVPAGYIWLVQRITVLCTSSTSTRAMVYAGSPAAQNFLDGTDRGNIDTADESSPILLESSLSLIVVWTGASVGAVGTARIQYQLVTRG